MSKHLGGQDEKRDSEFSIFEYFLFAVSYDSFVTGVNYDKKHKIYIECSGGCMSFCDYGFRWIRLGQAATATGFLVLLTTFIVAVKEQKGLKLPSILIKE